MTFHKYLTPEIPGTGGVIKETPEDFCVTELPLYLPCGEGEHSYALIEKRGVTTLDAVRRLAKALGISDRDIGYAGMKDARALTRQTVSIPRIPPEQLLALELPGIRILTAERHRNKLKLGHLAGNRFSIRVLGVEPGALSRAESVLEIVQERGVPNYFGAQRYGSQGNSHLIGHGLLRGDFHEAVDALIGNPESVRDERWRSAIEAYQRGDLAGSIGQFPGHCRTERDILQRLAKQPDEWEKALRAVHPRLMKLYLSAYQSFLFDRLLDVRLADLDKVLSGDLALKHDNGACFVVEDAAAEAGRAERFEISPSGPLFGCKMMQPLGAPLAMEEAILREAGVTLQSFDLAGGLRMEGERRPLRVPVKEAHVKAEGDGLLLEFDLPKGAYATSLLREIMKSDI